MDELQGQTHRKLSKLDALKLLLDELRGQTHRNLSNLDALKLLLEASKPTE